MLIVCSLVFFILYLLRMRIKFEYCTKMVSCFSFIVNCAKQDAPIKGPKHVLTCLNAHAQLVLFNRMFIRQFYYKNKLSQKALSTLSIYKIVIRLNKSSLSKGESSLWQTDRHVIRFCFSCSKTFEHWKDALTT